MVVRCPAFQQSAAAAAASAGRRRARGRGGRRAALPSRAEEGAGTSGAGGPGFSTRRSAAVSGEGRGQPRCPPQSTTGRPACPPHRTRRTASRSPAPPRGPGRGRRRSCAPPSRAW
uniref:Uncharacterized protein n=1 Tax=Mustela putorius furo TaxID=9669 RepID=M3YX32_MUSPF